MTKQRTKSTRYHDEKKRDLSAFKRIILLRIIITLLVVMILIKRNAIDNNIEGKHVNISDSRDNTYMTNIDTTINQVDEFNYLSNNQMIHFHGIDPK